MTVSKATQVFEGFVKTSRRTGIRRVRRLRCALGRRRSRGADVVEVYKDRGESAKTIDRPDFQRLIERINTQHDIHYVIVCSVDRANRNVVEEMQMADAIRATGAV